MSLGLTIPTTRVLSVIDKGITLFTLTKSSGKTEIAVGSAFNWSAEASFKPICAPKASFNCLIVTKPSLTRTEPNGTSNTLASASAIVNCFSLKRPSSIKISPILLLFGDLTALIGLSCFLIPAPGFAP